MRHARWRSLRNLMHMKMGRMFRLYPLRGRHLLRMMLARFAVSVSAACVAMLLVIDWFGNRDGRDLGIEVQLEAALSHHQPMSVTLFFRHINESKWPSTHWRRWHLIRCHALCMILAARHLMRHHDITSILPAWHFIRWPCISRVSRDGHFQRWMGVC